MNRVSSKIFIGILLGYFILCSSSCSVVALLKFPRPKYGCRMRSYLDVNVPRYLQVRYEDLATVNVGIAPFEVPEHYRSDFGDGNLIRNFLQDKLTAGALKNTAIFNLVDVSARTAKSAKVSYHKILKTARAKGFQFILYGYFGDPSEETEIALYTHLVDTFDETEIWYGRTLFYEKFEKGVSSILSAEQKLEYISKCTVDYMWRR